MKSNKKLKKFKDKSLKRYSETEKYKRIAREKKEKRKK